MIAILRIFAMGKVVAALLAVAFLVGPWKAERIGDRWQIALPLIAWGCAGAKGAGSEFALRYAIMFTSAHAAKQGLGDAPFNMRPNGGDEGFPSAHTSTAVLGASSLLHDCLKGAPLVQAFVITTAAFTGASRIEAGKHDIWQVLAGALLGFFCERALRQPSPVRRRVRQAIRALSQGLRNTLRQAGDLWQGRA